MGFSRAVILFSLKLAGSLGNPKPKPLHRRVPAVAEMERED